MISDELVRELIISTFGPKMEGYAPQFKTTAQMIAKYEIAIKRNLDIIQDKRVLDLGCHIGNYGLTCLQEGAIGVTGVDSQKKFREGMLKFLKNHSEFNYLPIHSNIYDLGKLTFPGFHETVLCLGVFCHLNNHIQFLSRLYQDHQILNLILGIPVIPEEKIPPSFKHYGAEGLMLWRAQDPNLDSFRGITRKKASFDQYTGFPDRTFVKTALNITGWKIDWIHDFINSPIPGLESTIADGNYLIIRCHKE